MGFLVSLFGSGEPSSTVREPAFDGLYYPSDAQELQSSVRSHLDREQSEEVDDVASVRGILVPHAEYAFAGELMGAGWALARRRSTPVERLVMVGSSERVPFQGVATSTHDAFRTPLGEVALDHAVIDQLLGADASQVRAIDVAFDPDPSIEVQLPFAQVACSSPSLVPLLVGDGDPSAMAQIISEALVDDSTLLVVCANLSEGLPADEAESRDQQTAEAIEAREGASIDRRASTARMAIQSALTVCSQREWTVTCCRRTTSAGKGGDIAGRHDEVVGYGTFVFG